MRTHMMFLFAVLAASTPHAQPATQLRANPLEDVDVFEDRLTPIYLSATATADEPIAFTIAAPPTNGRVTDPIPVQGSPNIVIVYYQSIQNAATDAFTFVATQGNATSTADVTIKIRDAGLRWDLSVAGTTSASQDVDALTQPNFLFRLDWMVKSPWHKHGEKSSQAERNQSNAEVAEIRKMLGYETSGALDTDAKDEGGNPLNRGTNIRFTFDTGFVSTPVMDTAIEIDTAMDGATSEEGEGGDSEETPVQTTQNAFRVSGEAAANFVINAGDGRTMAELGGAARGAYNVPIQEDQILRQDGATFINLSSDERSPGFFVFEAFARFRLTQFEDENNFAIDPRKIEADGGVHAVHPKNLEDLLVVEAGYQRNDGLSNESVGTTEMEAAMGGAAASAMAMAADPGVNRWFFRFMASPEIPGSGHTKALVGLEVSDGLDDGAIRNVRVFYGVNVAVDRLFR